MASKKIKIKSILKRKNLPLDKSVILPFKIFGASHPLKHDITHGFITKTHTKDASRCVESLESQFGPPPKLNIAKIARSFRLPDPTSGTYGLGDHNQGVGMLADTIIRGQRFARAVLSFNSKDSTGLMVVGRAIPNGVDGFYSDPRQIDYREGQQILDIQNVPAFGSHNHPGGLQAHGDYVAVAMEQPMGSDKRAAVYFIHVDGMKPKHVYTHFLGGNPSSTDIRLDSAASVGFVKLASGGFLMAVSGENHGRAGIWFYDSTDTVISPTMTWRYVDFWNPKTRMPKGVCQIEDGKVADDCYIGGGGATSLLTGCDGQIYLIALTGTAELRSKDDEYFQVMRLSQAVDGKIVLESIRHGKRKLGRSAIDNIAFRWGAGAQVTHDGKLVLLSTERRTNEGSNDTVDGAMRFMGDNQY